MSIYTSRTFWAGVAERAIKTAAQTLLASLAVGQAITAIDWQAALAITGTAVVASVLTSLADPARADTAVATGAPNASVAH